MKLLLTIIFAAISFTIFSQKMDKFTDSRDGQVYKTVKIGNQLWMAESLAFKTKGCWAYKDDLSNVKKYGYLYNWLTAQNVCPAGWRLPSKDDFTILLNNFKGKNDKKASYKALKPKGKSGFSASLGGWRYKNGYYTSIGKNGNFWSSTLEHEPGAWKLYFTSYSKEASMEASHMGSGLSVRCIKNN